MVLVIGYRSNNKSFIIMKKHFNTRRTILLQIALIIGVAVSAIALQSYAAYPTQAPPGGNAPAPLNVSGYAQQKAGGLILNTAGASNGLIIANGNVGIGTTNPTSKLDVSGNANITGSLTTKTLNVTNACLGGVCRTSWSSGGVIAVQGPKVTGPNAGATIVCPTGYALTGWFNKDIYLDFNNSRTYNPQMTKLYGQSGGQSGIAFWNGGHLGGSSITQQTIFCTPGTFKFVGYSGGTTTGGGTGGGTGTGLIKIKIN